MVTVNNTNTSSLSLNSSVSLYGSGWLLNVEPVSSIASFEDTAQFQLLRKEGPVNRFRKLLGPCDWQHFQTEVLHRKPLILRHTLENTEHLLSWDVVNKLLIEHESRWPRLNLVKNGKPASPTSFLTTSRTTLGRETMQLRVAELVEYLQDGATLVINAIDEMVPPIRQVAEDLEYLFGTHIQINAYLSFGSQPGFDTHWDDHDVFVIQVAGSKDWCIYRPSLEKPHKQTTPYWHNALKQGDLLYLPRGWWHRVSAQEEPSIHLTCGVPFKQGNDFIEWLKNTIPPYNPLYCDLPTNWNGNLAVLVKAFQQAWESMLTTERLQEYLLDSNIQALSRPQINLPAILQPEELVADRNNRLSSRLPRPTLLAVTHDHVQLYALGNVYTFIRDIEPLLRDIMTAEEAPIGAILSKYSNLGNERVLAFLCELLIEELIAVITDESNRTKK